MMILVLDNAVDFKNSVDYGRISYALLPEKQQKTDINLVRMYVFRKTPPRFYMKFIAALASDYSLYLKPLKAISIATPQAAQSN